MTKSALVAQNTSVTGISDNTTEYWPPIRLTGTTAADRTQMPIRLAGTVGNLFIYVSDNTASVTSVITFQINGADSAITVSYTADQTGIKEDTSNKAAIANTDTINYKIVVPTEVGSNTISVRMSKIEFTPSDFSKCLQLMGAHQVAVFNTDSTTWYFVPMGNTNTSLTSETTGAKYRVRYTVTSSNLYAYASSNARTTDTVIGSRVDGANGNQSVTYTSGQTGAKEDTSNTDSLIAGQDFNYFMTTSTGGGDFAINHISTQFISSNGIFPLVAGMNGGSQVQFNSVEYFAVSSGAAGQAPDQASAQTYPHFNLTASELGVFVSANTIATDPSTVTLEDNGTASAMTVSYNAAQTGLKNDSSNTADITRGADELNYVVTTPNTSGILTLRWMGILATPTSEVQVNIGDLWKSAGSPKINIGDTWKEVVGIQINIGDTWKTIL